MTPVTGTYVHRYPLRTRRLKSLRSIRGIARYEQCQSQSRPQVRYGSASVITAKANHMKTLSTVDQCFQCPIKARIWNPRVTENRAITHWLKDCLRLHSWNSTWLAKEHSDKQDNRSPLQAETPEDQLDFFNGGWSPQSRGPMHPKSECWDWANRSNNY